VSGGQLEVARVQSIADDDLREAYRRRTQLKEDNFLFRSPVTGRELSASFDRFPAGFPRPWEAIVLTPTDDFVGALKVANRQTVAVIAVLTVLELVLIYALSLRLSRPIEGVSRQLHAGDALPRARRRVRRGSKTRSCRTLSRVSGRAALVCARPEEIVREVARRQNDLSRTVAR
jgi:adenylate cyclase